MARGFGAIGIPGCSKSPMRALMRPRTRFLRSGSSGNASTCSAADLVLMLEAAQRQAAAVYVYDSLAGEGASMTVLMEDSFAPYLESISELFADSLVSFFAYPRELFRTIGFERIAVFIIAQGACDLPAARVQNECRTIQNGPLQNAERMAGWLLCVARTLSSNSAALYTIAQQFRLGNTFETIGD